MKVKFIQLSLFVAAFAALAGVAGAQTRGKKARVQNVKVEITEQGFAPSALNLKRGVPARITFLRKTDKTCATQVVFPTLKMNRELPLNTPVVIAFTPRRTGELGFACGMNMMRGKVIVR